MKLSSLWRPLGAVGMFLVSQALVSIVVAVVYVAINKDVSMPGWLLGLVSILSGLLAVALCMRPLRIVRPLQSLKPSGMRWAEVLQLMLGALIGLLGVSLVSEQVQAPDLLEQQFKAMADSGIAWLAVAFIGPVVEEYIFREGLMGGMMRGGIHPAWALGLSSLIFGMVHLNPAQVLAAGMMGFVLGALYLRSKNILLCGALHVMNNTASMCLYRFTNLNATDTPLTDLLWHSPVAAWLAAALCLALSFRMLYRPSALQKAS